MLSTAPQFGTLAGGYINRVPTAGNAQYLSLGSNLGLPIAGNLPYNNNLQPIGVPVARNVGLPIGSQIPLRTVGSQIPLTSLGQQVQGLQGTSIQGFPGQPIQGLQGPSLIYGQQPQILGQVPLGLPPNAYINQAHRPLNLPYGMLLPPSYAGYRTLND